jgi:hypothetical protein
MLVICHTNLDLRNEVWPIDLPCVPRVGDNIQSQTRHRGGLFQLELKVCRVTWKPVRQSDYEYGRPVEYIPHIELHMTDYHAGLYPPHGVSGEKGSIVAFYHWYAPLVGSYVGAFI